MSRRRAAERRTVQPDAVYNDFIVSQFINSLMKDGKKSIAEKILYSAIERLNIENASENKEEKIKQIDVFKTAIQNIRPSLEVKSRRVGGSTYQVPVKVREERQLALAIRWIIIAAKARNGKTLAEKLSAELLDAYYRKGTAFKKKEDTHRMADANKAFAHYVW